VVFRRCAGEDCPEIEDGLDVVSLGHHHAGRGLDHIMEMQGAISRGYATALWTLSVERRPSHARLTRCGIVGC
jgi:hypothetical protein